MVTHSKDPPNGAAYGNNVIYAENVPRIIRSKDRNRFYTPQEPPILFYPPLFKGFIEEINQTGMIIFGGKDASRNDRNQFARSFAYKLKTSHDTLKIFEWRKNTNIFDIPALLTAREKGIYVITEITPQMVQYNLESIREVVQRKSHFLICTTNIILEKWAEFAPSLNLFHELTAQALYDDGYLALNLVELIHRSSFSLSQEARGEFIEAYKEYKDKGSGFKKLISYLLSPNRSIEYVAARLRETGYDDLEKFVRVWLADEKGKFSDEMIDQIIDDIIPRDRDFLKWYYQDLEERDRHLLLGMSLFSGLYENQFFAAIEELVENEWRLREPMLYAFDYADLAKLQNYAVDLIETGEIERKIEVKQHLRRHVFSECWHNQKRLMVNSIYGMMNIVKNSIHRLPSLKRDSEFRISDDEEFREISKTSTKSQLYSSGDKIKLIHHIVGSTLRQIAYESLPLAEEALFYYASENNMNMRNLAAQSLAQWKNRENDLQENEKYAQELYEMLNRWYKKTGNVIDQFGFRLSKTRHGFIEERKKFLYATIMLTIGYAACHDPPNQCAPQLLKLLREFIPPLREEEKSGPVQWKVVADALAENTVPLLMKHHLKQLHETDLLYNLMRYATSARFIAYELSLSHLKNPYLFNSIIDRLNEICEPLKKIEKKYQKIVKKLKRRGKRESDIPLRQVLRIYPPRERLMSILIATYGSLQFVDAEEWLSAGETFRRLKKIFKKEPEESLLRDAVADAVGAQISRDFHNLKHLIRNILGIFHQRHYPRIVAAFNPRISKERKRLKKGLAKKKRKAEEKFAQDKRKAMLRDTDTEFDEDAFDPEKQVTNTELELFQWILKGGYRFRLLGLLGLFRAHLNRLGKKGAQLAKFDKLLKGKFSKKYFSRLFISPLCLLGLRTPMVILHLLPVISILDKSIQPEFREMLKIWRSKIEQGSIRRLGWALTIAVNLANNVVLLLAIYLFLVLLVWSVVDRF